jgi:hypothetical protein
MNTQPVLTDAMIETMLVHRADHPTPIGLAQRIITTVVETPRVGRPWWTRLLPPARQAPVQRLVWIVALVGLLLAATASAVFVGSELLRRANELAVLPAPTTEATAAPSPSSETADRGPAQLQPTGIITPSGQAGWLATPSALAVGSDGSAWVLFSSGLLRVDPDGSVREWSLADDAAFGAAQGLAPSQLGGVWMFDATTLRLFDGETFTDVVTVPEGSGTGSVTDATEGPDGQLWVTTEQGVLHWDGAAWTSLPWTFDALPGEIGFDARGRLWVGLDQYPGPLGLGVATYDGGGWSDPQGGSPGRAIVRSIASSADGSTWFGTESGLARFDGSAWSWELPFGSPGSPASSVSVGPDGSVWVVSSGGSGVPRIAALKGGTWQELDLPSDLEAVGGRSWVLVGAAGDGVVLALDGGVLRLTGEDWTRIWPEASPAGPRWVWAIAAVSAEDVVAGSSSGGSGGIWRLRAGAWERDAFPGSPDSPVRSLAFGSDGSLWAGGDGWVKVVRDGAWTSVLDGAELLGAFQIVPAADGTVWVAAGYGGVVALRPDGSTWRPDTLDRAPQDLVTSVAAGSDGTIWAGSYAVLCTKGPGPTDCNGTGLARFDGQAWTLEHPLGAPSPEDGELRVNDLLVASDGSLWMAAEEWGGSAKSARSFVARFADGAWTVLLDTASRVVALAEHPDGSILAAGSGIWTFRGGEWTQELGDVSFGQLSIAPDGSVWVSGEYSSVVSRIR